MVYGIVMGTIKEIITIYSCLEAVDSAVLAKTGRKLFNRKKSLTKNGKFFFFPITGNLQPCQIRTFEVLMLNVFLPWQGTFMNSLKCFKQSCVLR